MTSPEDPKPEPVDGPDAGGSSQGEPGVHRSGTGEDAGREEGAPPDSDHSTNEKADSSASVDESGSKKDPA